MNDVANALFVGGIAERPQERHGDGSDAVVEKGSDSGAYLVFVERHHHTAVAVHPLGDLEGVALVHKTVRLALRHHVLQLLGGAAEIPAFHVHDVDRVAVAFGGQEPDVGHVAHHQGVERRRGAVRDVVSVRQHLVERLTQLLRQHTEDVHDAL